MFGSFKSNVIFLMQKVLNNSVREDFANRFLNIVKFPQMNYFLSIAFCYIFCCNLCTKTKRGSHKKLDGL